MIPADLASFMRWFGLLETDPTPKPVIDWSGKWYTEAEIPF